MDLRRPIRSAISAATRLFGMPAARRQAPPEYFRPLDPRTIEPRRVAIVACHWIGDTFWATQVMPLLARRWPGAEFYAIGQPHCLDLWDGLIPPERRLPVAAIVSDRRRQRVSWRAIRDAAAKLRPLDFDLVIDLTGNRYSALFTFLLRPSRSVGFGGQELGWLYSLRMSDAERPGHHLSERPFRVIEPLIGKFDPPAALLPPKTSVDAEPLLRELGVSRPFVVIAPGAGWAAKRWPVGNFVAVRDRLRARGLSVAIAGSAAEEPLCQQVAGNDGTLLVGRPLAEVIAVLGESNGLVANDSGLAHLAAALGKPTAAIFTGATDPALCRPLGERARVFDLRCNVNDVLSMI